jgi:rod shape-determining protein MreC
MPLGTLDRTPPPFFRQGPSALSKLLVFGSLAILLMLADGRWHWAPPLRSAIAVVLQPMQWLAQQPLQAVHWVGQYLQGIDTTQQALQAARAELVRQAQRSAQVEHLGLENQTLRELLGMRQGLDRATLGATVVYEMADPYSRKVVIDQGQLQGVQAGAAVLDGFGVLGQVTRVYPHQAEVTLLTDDGHSIAVLNARTGQRSLAQGMPRRGADRLELRYVSVEADAEAGDLLTTSGLDGIYPPGLPVAVIRDVTRPASGFARITADPVARLDSVRLVLLVLPAKGQP